MGVLNQPITKKQQELLQCLYNFRFATIELLTNNLILTNKSNVRIRLNKLYRLGYIGRHYNLDYKIQQKPAVYFLLPKSFPILRKLDDISEKVLKNMYRDSHASERFIDYCVNVYKIYIALKNTYDDKLWFFTINNLKFPQYDYFPHPYPDAYISLKLNDSPRGKRKHFFLIFCNSQTPTFVYINQLKSLINYRSNKEWERATNSSLSSFLFIVESDSYIQRLSEKLAHQLHRADLEDELSYYICTLSNLTKLSPINSALWQSITQPAFMRALEKM